MENENLPFGSQFKEAWNEWLQYRKERKFKNYVPTGLSKTFSLLRRISGNNEQTAIEIVNQSMEYNYQGLFPLKKQSQYGTNRFITTGKTIEFDRI